MKINTSRYFGKTGGIVALVAIFILLVVFAPWFFIWSVNTLFPAAAIPFNFDTWCAVVLLHAFFRTAVSVSK
jgi:hypothetical protein